MIETLRTTQIAFLIRNAYWASGEAEARYKKYLCKGKSYETTCENIVSWYQTLVSSLLREPVFQHRRPKTEMVTSYRRALKAAAQ